MADDQTAELSILSGPQELYDLFSSLATVETDDLAEALTQGLDAAISWLRYPLDFQRPSDVSREKYQNG